MSAGPVSLEVTTPGGYWNKVDKQDWFAAWIDRLDRAGQAEDFTFETVTIPTFSPTIFYVCLVIIVVPGIVGNVLLFLLSRSPEISAQPYSLYLSAISISDSVALLASYVDSILQANGFVVQIGIVSIHWCRFAYVCSKTAVTVSPWLLVCFSLDRYVALVFPLKRKVVCTFRNVKILTALVPVLCLTTQVLMSLMIEPIHMRGSPSCAIVTQSGSIIMQMELGINMLVPVFALFFINTHSLIAVKIAIAERMKLRTSSAGENIGLSGGGGLRGSSNGQNGARKQAKRGTKGNKGGIEDTEEAVPTEQPSTSGGNALAATRLGLESKEPESWKQGGQPIERPGEAPKRNIEAPDRDNRGEQAECTAPEGGPQYLEKRSLSRSGQEPGCNAEREPGADDKQQDMVRGQPGTGDREMRGAEKDGGRQDIQYEEDGCNGPSNKADGMTPDGSQDRARGPSNGGGREDGGKERNPGRRREDPASSQSGIRRMSRLLLSIPVFSFVCMVPYAFVITSLFLSMSSMSERRPSALFVLLEPYFRIVFTVGYAGNFYLLIGTSKKYRDLASKIVPRRCCRRQN